MKTRVSCALLTYRNIQIRSPSGRSSGVEHNLAKVGVGRSNRLARSIISVHLQILPSGK